MDGTGSTERVAYHRVTVAEAAAILGVTVVTVRRMIKRGQLEGERVIRPQGSAYLVTLPVDGTGAERVAESTEHAAQNMSRTDGTPGALMAVWSETLLSPLVARMAEQEATIRGQAEMIGSLTEQVDGRERELDRSSAEIASLSGQLAEADVSRRRYVGIANALAIVLVVAGVLAIAAVLAPAAVMVAR